MNEPRRIPTKRRGISHKGVDLAPYLEAKERLGDKIASALESVGVTPASWQKLKERIGLPPGCNCPERKVWINQVDEALGLAEKVDLFKKLIGWRE